MFSKDFISALIISLESLAPWPLESLHLFQLYTKEPGYMTNVSMYLPQSQRKIQFLPLRLPLFPAFSLLHFAPCVAYDIFKHNKPGLLMQESRYVEKTNWERHFQNNFRNAVCIHYQERHFISHAYRRIQYVFEICLLSC